MSRSISQSERQTASRKKSKSTPSHQATRQESYVRFRLSDRIEHFILLTSFTILGVTGIPQMFANTGWGVTLINLMGGIEFIRIVHRVAACGSRASVCLTLTSLRSTCWTRELLLLGILRACTSEMGLGCAVQLVWFGGVCAVRLPAVGCVEGPRCSDPHDCSIPCQARVDLKVRNAAVHSSWCFRGPASVCLLSKQQWQ